jgi:phosphatidylglycerol:prolipoprotein diacylglycerol transferase
MYPILYQFGPFKLHMYGLMIAIGFLVILYFMQRDAKRALGVDPNETSTMAFWVLVLGTLGTRVLHILMYPQFYSWSDPVGWINLTNGGLVFQGAIIPALVYTVYALRKRKIPFWPMVDCAAPYVPLAEAFGRIGCFFNGCCYGARADHLPWAICFPPQSPPWQHQHDKYPGALGLTDWSFPVHPTQLYSSFSLFLIFVVLLLLRKYWHPFPGFTFALYLVFTGIYRVIVEFFRDDMNPTNLGFGVLTNQQVFALLSVVIGAWLFWYLWQRHVAEKKATV